MYTHILTLNRHQSLNDWLPVMKKNQAYTFGLDKQVHGVPIIVFSFGHMSLVCFYVITAELFDNK